MSLKNKFYKEWFNRFILDEIKADLGRKGDITSGAVINDKFVDAIVESRENGVIAGIEEVVYIYRKNRIQVKVLKKDGDKIRKGSKILELRGKEKDLLRIERSALDLLQRMSGIATLTYSTIHSINSRIPIAPTRKTQWRYLDKKAVFVGKGLTHRLALWESILIKDNHLRALEKEGVESIVEVAIKRAWKRRKTANFIEIEVGNLKQALDAGRMFKTLNKGSYPCLVMLDNIPPKKISAIIEKLKKEKLFGHVLLEASGGITPRNVKNYINTGVDVISMGFLTHSSHALDIKQYIK